MKKVLFFVIAISLLAIAMMSAEVRTNSLEYILLHREYLSTDTDNNIILNMGGTSRQLHGEFINPDFGVPYYSSDCQTYWVAVFIYSRKELDTYLKKNNCNGWLLVELKKSKIYQIKQEAIIKTTRREIIEEHLKGYRWEKEEYPVEKLVPETLYIFNWEVDTIGSREDQIELK